MIERADMREWQCLLKDLLHHRCCLMMSPVILSNYKFIHISGVVTASPDCMPMLCPLNKARIF